MNTHLFITALAFLFASFAGAQNVSEAPKPDPVMEAIQELSDRDQEPQNESAIAADEDAEPSVQAQVQAEAQPQSSEPPAPVLVTGTPPPAIEKEDAQESTPQEAAVPTIEEEKPKPENGLNVRIEKLHSGNEAIDPSLIKLRAPFPAKPLAQAPPGWRLDNSESAPPFAREVELSPGSKIILSIRPHLLVPDSDGTNSFNIEEPGYENSLGYEQTSTVGAILANSIRQLDDDAKRLSTAVDSLQQLLISLPKPPAQPAPEPEPAQIAKPATNIRKK
jgi:hypothetical protein